MKFEHALAEIEEKFNGTLKAAQNSLQSAKKVSKAIKTGNMKDLPKLLESTDEAIRELREKFEAARNEWQFDVDGYFNNGEYIAELLETAKANGISIFEQDDLLFCYPMLLKFIPGERVLKIDKKKEKRLRPEVLVQHLKALQDKPVQFRPEAFIKTLLKAYLAINGKKSPEKCVPVALKDIYDLLTLLPGQSRQYTIQEFTRDIYLLDKSGVTQTRNGYRMSFESSTGSKNTRKTLTVVTRNGSEKKYFGIAFH